MSRLNNTLRFTATFFNTWLFVAGLVVIILGAAVLTVTLKFHNTTMGGWLSWFLIGGIVLTLLSIEGCCGIFRQTERTGKCSGRKLLSLYQMVLMGVTIGFLFGILFVRTLISNFQYVERNPSSGMDTTERSLEPYYNTFYWKSQTGYGSGQKGYMWFVKWVKNHCPSSADITSCNQCTTVLYDPDTCCPDYDRCNAGTSTACPYQRCRTQLATYMRTELRPFEEYIYVAVLIFVLVLFNICLLICYNPRDSLSDLLTKTGIVMHAQQKPRTPRRTPRSKRSPTTSASVRSRSPPQSPEVTGAGDVRLSMADIAQQLSPSAKRARSPRSSNASSTAPSARESVRDSTYTARESMYSTARESTYGDTQAFYTARESTIRDSRYPSPRESTYPSPRDSSLPSPRESTRDSVASAMSAGAGGGGRRSRSPRSGGTHRQSPRSPRSHAGTPPEGSRRRGEDGDHRGSSSPREHSPRRTIDGRA